jgi:threonine dehydrogenase-like Zn-dependent dehydrogenase
VHSAKLLSEPRTHRRHQGRAHPVVGERIHERLELLAAVVAAEQQRDRTEPPPGAQAREGGLGHGRDRIVDVGQSVLACDDAQPVR